MKINIAYIIPSLDMGGSEQKVIDLASALDKNIFNPIIITITKKGVLSSKADELGIKVICACKKHKLDLFVIDRMAFVLKENKIDIVHVFTSTGKLWGRLAAFKAKTKVVISTEESLFRDRCVDRFLERRFFKKTSLIITNSQASKTSAINTLKLSKDKYKVILNGVNLKPFLENYNNKNLIKQGNEKIIICVARFDYRKSIHTLIEAFSYIQQTTNAKLVLIGNGPEEERLKEKVRELNLEDKVIFLGFRNDVYKLLKEADLFVLPSIEEGFGNVIIEAMASKVCVIASRVGGIPEIIDNEINGLMFEKGNTHELQNLILKVLSDEKLRVKLVSNAFLNINKFSQERMVLQHEETYIELMKGGKRL